MSAFTPAELAFLTSQRLGRLATIDAAGEPHVVPVAFRYNPDLDTIDIGGWGMGRSKKYRDVGRTGRAAFVVDDVPQPGQVRGVEVRGRAEPIAEGGSALNANADPQFIRLTPRRIIGWGIDTDPRHPHSRDVRR